MFWTDIQKPLKKITSGASHTIWGIDTEDQIVYLDQDDYIDPWKKAKPLPDGAIPLDISCGFDGELYVTDTLHYCYHLHADGNWSPKIGRDLHAIGVGSQQKVVAISGASIMDPSLCLYQSIPMKWVHTRTFEAGRDYASMKVSVGSDGTTCWVNGSTGFVYLLWWPIPGHEIPNIGGPSNTLKTKFQLVSVAAANDIYCVDDENNIWFLFGDWGARVYRKLIEGTPDGKGGYSPSEITGGKIVHFVHSDLNTGYMIYQKGSEYTTYKMIPRSIDALREAGFGDSVIDNFSTGETESVSS